MNQENYFRCKWCGKKFKRNYRHRFYCSKDCARSSYKNNINKRCKKWRDAHADQYKEYMRSYMQKYRKRKKKPERFYQKAGTVYLKKTKDWKEELELLEKLLYPLKKTNHL